MGGLLQLPPAPRSSRWTDSPRAALGKEILGQGVTEVLRPYSLWMAPRAGFEIDLKYLMLDAQSSPKRRRTPSDTPSVRDRERTGSEDPSCFVTDQIWPTPPSTKNSMPV